MIKGTEHPCANDRHALDIVDVTGATNCAGEALRHIEAAARLLVSNVWEIDRAVEVYVAVRMLDGVERLRLTAEIAPRAMKPLIDRIEGEASEVREGFPSQTGSRPARKLARDHPKSHMRFSASRKLV